MDLRTLKYFVTVAEELNVTRAAEILNMSQPPLSSQIKNLEEELNTQLFIRGRRRLELTDAGRLLYSRANEILRLSEKTTTEILSLSKGVTGTISIGLVEGMAPDIAAEWISSFIKEYPNVRFKIIDGNTDYLVEKLRGGLISLAVIVPPFDTQLLHKIPVGKENFCAFISRDHPLAKDPAPTIRIEQLLHEPLIFSTRDSWQKSMEEWFIQYNETPNIICQMDSYLDAAVLAGKGVGISIFPQTASIPNDIIVSKLIEGLNQPVEYYFVWRKGHLLATAQETFIDYIKKLYLKGGKQNEI